MRPYRYIKAGRVYYVRFKNADFGPGVPGSLCQLVFACHQLCGWFFVAFFCFLVPLSKIWAFPGRFVRGYMGAGNKVHNPHGPKKSLLCGERCRRGYTTYTPFFIRCPPTWHDLLFSRFGGFAVAFVIIHKFLFDYSVVPVTPGRYFPGLVAFFLC